MPTLADREATTTSELRGGHEPLRILTQGRVFVLSGPSGVGKSTLIELLKQDQFPITYCVTATTRKRRNGEIDGVHYFFLSEEEFDRKLTEGGFLEWAVVHNEYRYGIPASSVQGGLSKGQDLIMAPDVQGAATVRGKLSDVITVFLEPPSLDELVSRLADRNTETEEQVRIRLATAQEEMRQRALYDYAIVNHRGRAREAVDELKAIITAERRRVHPRIVKV